MESLLKEFWMCKDLEHTNIIKHYYFISKYKKDHEEETYEYHILMEYLEGKDMKKYLEMHGRAFNIVKIKEIGS